jgi:ribosomal subunit interface protein
MSVAASFRVDIEIQTQHAELTPECRTLIDERLAALATRYPELIRVHVTLKHGAHHQHGLEEAAIVARCAGATLRAAKQEETMRAAVHAALDALERTVATRHERHH